ncbi:MAG: endonuclease/exonuclease/phosphatase family protein, partial [Ignavibacteriales bacterium]|nr:endonuclease/exonuclease/phosphatase family protein [Ignavibacteriales bacterium]
MKPFNYSASFFVVIIQLALTCPANSQAARITLDGLFSDWQSLNSVYTDSSGDIASGVIDFGRLWCANDEHYLFLRLEVGGEIFLQDSNIIILYLDTDNNASTGIPIGGIGADLRWNFGQRIGFFTTGTGTNSINHSKIGLISAPVITSTQYELVLSRQARPDSVEPLFSSDTIRIVITDEGPGGDLLPDYGSVEYVFDNSPLPSIESLAIQKFDEDHIRVLGYNVFFDGLFDPVRVASYTRILQAIRPDFIGFQEMYNHTAAQTVQQVQSMLPPEAGQQWYGSKVGPDIVVVSQFPIVSSFDIFNSGNGAFLLDLRPRYDSDMLLIVAHPPCCQNNTARQNELDAIMAFIRDAKQPGGLITLAPNTPILMIGDMNLVGYSRQLRTLLSGEIVDTLVYGPRFAPDWDESDLSDLLPRHPDRPLTYTWRNDLSSYPPGRLDYMIYTD